MTVKIEKTKILKLLTKYKNAAHLEQIQSKNVYTQPNTKTAKPNPTLKQQTQPNTKTAKPTPTLKQQNPTQH
jgi:hypothetical protein